ncbi:HigA family addiction module antitoxin [Leptolyngbya sp. NIES-2104]|uniref:HigA family addiction module antitoxin n=1 Tax=Leptolyngbya sp. NIES-2104 TaxID=1552121 RepID=UPI0006EC6237|nr:HigA family addiction module antitoxin [Leptolyngbya sp. NIES-2104]GAP97804.1 HigA protein [Leptolyngbya sp. NIES-2104]
MTQPLQPAKVFAPGRVISEELEARDWTQKDLAEIMSRPPQTINEIIKGTKQITPETALELSAAFGTSAEFWINLEANYQLFLARQTQVEKPIARKSKIYNRAPVSEMTKLGWLQETKLIDELEQQVCTFYGISNIDETPQVAMGMRRSEQRQPKISAQTAWAKRVENLARQQRVAVYDRQNLIQAIPELAKMSLQLANVARVPEFLMDHGVRFVIVPHLSKTYLDGAALHLDNQIAQPVIALTLRHNRNDNFWFVLMHELAHIVLGHEGLILDNLDEEDVDENEVAANEMGRNWLLDPIAYNQFLEQAQPSFSESKIISFATHQMRHPGIVVGRLRWEGRLSYSQLNKHILPVKNELQDWLDVAQRDPSKSVAEILQRSQSRRKKRSAPPPELDSTRMIQDDRNR